jgi:tRNA uridine 5-carboxymethylaminomethyl modification enzyme
VDSESIFGKTLEREYTLFTLLKRPSVRYADLLALKSSDGSTLGAPADGVDPDPSVARQVEIAAKYDGYIARQRLEVARHESHETTTLPESLDYAAVPGLSVEARQKLAAHRPATVGQAGRISGVTPAAISLLLVHLKRLRQSASASGDPGRPDPADAGRNRRLAA